MQDTRPKNMAQRRVIYFIIRGMLFCLAIFGLWRMISVISENSYLVKEEHELKDDHVFIEVYYESMCPDSKYFIKHQLIPTIEKIPEIIDFRLIPYGKAKTIENATGIFFTCQHRELECQGNKIHACGIKYISNRSKQLNFASCLINNIRNPQSVAESCALEVNANWDEIQKCSISMEGSELLKGYGEETHNLSPSVTFIPTVVLDKNQGHQKDILKDLLKEVCSKYSGDKPPPCL
ncbi:GILT-like protein 1 [Daphnia pulicaria]|uniref:GILT-like protein 1 n=1 Tax=Daphnia pulicaria TaxID=35523 RepID=UPI001EEA4960|nr:GILT-like protein 1 [Daphnia pulicaria]